MCLTIRHIKGKFSRKINIQELQSSLKNKVIILIFVPFIIISKYYPLNYYFSKNEKKQHIWWRVETAAP